VSGENQPYSTRGQAARAFAAHVNRGKTRVLESIGADIVVGEREGGRFRDAYSGRWYWNCHSNGGVFNLGHRHPRLVAALREALDHLDIGNHHLISGWRALLAERLSASTGDRLPYTVFAPSGSEAIDLAIRLARRHTGRERIVSVLGAYHGLAGLGWAASDPRWTEVFGHAPPGFSHVVFNDTDAMRTEIERGDVAAVILEAIPATLGFPPPEPGYLPGVERACRDNGSLLIVDEVQTGLGRTGTRWYFEQEDIQPDVLITGKGLSGGLYPISAALISERLEEFFDANPFAYVSTFGGAELGCVVGDAVVELIDDEVFLARVRELGERFESGFEGLPFELRRRGMTMGLRFDEPQGGVEAARRLIEAGVFAVFAEHDHSVTQFKPALVLSDEEADEIIGLARDALS
jgi:acetylornithine aminotransferase